MHLGIKSFKCTFSNCEKSFVTKGNLNTHYLKHTGAKPFSCNFENCKKSFTIYNRLKVHFRTHVIIYINLV
jgi:uncharacterized Zn-finger protein